MRLSHIKAAGDGVVIAPTAGRRAWFCIAVPVAALGALAVLMLAGNFGTPWNAVPASAELLGFSGHVGEWELTATVTRKGETRELSGPVKMTHVGWCGQDGPEVKSGEVSIQLARLTSSIDMRLQVDGAECTFRGSLTDVYAGTMTCPDKRPVPLSLWLR